MKFDLVILRLCDCRAEHDFDKLQSSEKNNGTRRDLLNQTRDQNYDKAFRYSNDKSVLNKLEFNYSFDLAVNVRMKYIYCKNVWIESCFQCIRETMLSFEVIV